MLGDRVWTTSRGHTLTAAEHRFTACDALVTPILIDSGHCPDTVAELLAAAAPLAAAVPERTTDPTNQEAGDPAGGGTGPSAGSALTPSAAARIAELATTLLGTRIPLAVGRTARTATPAQRRALAARDRGCIIPGCGIPAEACQTHHVTDWAADGNTDLPNMALLCWAHHRQVDLGMWTIVPARHPRSGAPTRTRSATRNPLARQPRRTLDHHPHPPNTLATVKSRAGQCVLVASSCKS